MTSQGGRSFRLIAGYVAGLAVCAGSAAAQTRPAAQVDSRPVAPHAESRPRAPQPQPTPEPEGDVSVRTHLDRTAVWVADRLTYTIEITCRRGVDILTGDLSRDKLTVEGLEVIGSDTARHAGSDDVTRYEFHYLLTTYRVDVPTLKIAPLTARYYIKRPGQRLEDTAPAGEVQVPGAAVAFRSLLPDDQPSYQIRDSRPAEQRLLAYRILQPVGIGLVILSIVPVALLAIGLARRAGARRGRTAGVSPRHARQAARESLEAIRATDPATAEARREAFARLAAAVRLHLAHVCGGVPTASLTPAEIVAAIEPRASRMPVDLVRSVLTACELARYAPPELLPRAEAWRATLADAEQVLAVDR